MKTIKESTLFLVQCNLAIHPTFYVFAESFADAATKASEIIKEYNIEKYIVEIKVLNIPLLDIQIV